MNLDELIISGVRRATEDVFTTMLGVDLAPAEASIETGEPEAHDGVVSLIGLAGTWMGAGCICCAPDLACHVYSRMLLSDATAVDEEVLDAVAELTNMIIGGVKTGLEAELGPLCLSIPTVVFGRNFRTKSAGTAKWVVLRFPWEGSQLIVKMCLTKAEKTHPAPHRPAQSCTLEV